MTRGRAVLQKVMGRQGGEVALLILSLIGLYFFAFRGMRFFLVPSGSMEPTLLRGDYILTLKASTYGRGDVVVLNDPEEPKSYIVKRVMGVGGDTIAMFGGAMFVNGSYVSEPYTMAPAMYEFDPFKVPEGHVLLFGDNRNDSEDSHLWKDKAQPVSAIIGKVKFIYYPYDRAGAFRETPPVMADRDILREAPSVM